MVSYEMFFFSGLLFRFTGADKGTDTAHAPGRLQTHPVFGRREYKRFYSLLPEDSEHKLSRH